MIKKVHLKKLNRFLVLIISIELLLSIFFLFKFYWNTTLPRETFETGVTLCLQEGRRYTINEAQMEAGACDIEISSDEDFAKLAVVNKGLSNVRSIYFRKTPNTSLPPEIGNLKNLTVLNFHHTFNTSLPPEIGQLKKLKVLKLDQADIENIPPEIGDLTSLTSLILINNAKKIALPAEIKKLKNLQELALSFNPEVELPSTLAKIQSLEELDLANSNLTEIPAAVYKLDNLKTLNLSGNQISTISSEVTDLISLKYLILTGNSLAAKDIESLKQLLPETQIVY